MNAERLRGVLELIREAEGDQDVQGKLNALRNALTILAANGGLVHPAADAFGK
jgi:hypothetical protein